MSSETSWQLDRGKGWRPIVCDRNSTIGEGTMGQCMILIVDDSPEDQEFYRRCLQRHSEDAYTILEASSGQQGLALWQQHQPDLVLLDYRLPDLDGLEFLAHLRSHLPKQGLPVIVVTGQGNEAIAVQAIKAGAQDYLVKEQITADRLQLAVNSAIFNLQLQTKLQQHIDRDRLVAEITRQVHRSLNLDEILQTTVTEVRSFLQTDRVFVVRLLSGGQGTVVAESVGAEWQSLMSSHLCNPCFIPQTNSSLASIDYRSCFGETDLECYRQGWVRTISDIQDAKLNPDYEALLEQFQVQANLIVPILHEDQFWGLLIAHHCVAPRQWQPLEISTLQQLVIQVSIALRQAELYQQAQRELQEHQQIATALQAANQRFQLATEAVNCVIYEWDLQTGRVERSRGLSHLLGYEAEETQLTAAWWHERVHPDDLLAIEERFNANLATIDRFSSEYRVRHEAGHYIWVEDRSVIVRNEAGQPIKIVGSTEDITDRKQAEVEREDLLMREQMARTEAERANRIKDEFLAILSHELRSPLNPILGWSKLLQTRTFEPDKMTEALATIERNGQLLTQLIDDLLDVAKILRGKLSLNTVPIDLAPVIESAIDTVKAAAVAKSIHLDVTLPKIGQVAGDSTRLHQIVWNLLSNAIKFTPAQGRVEVTLSVVSRVASNSVSSMTGADSESIAEYAQIMVKDTGKGITSDFQPYLFESFRQEDISTTRKYGGLGLGLAIVRHLVEAHDGTITAESAGEGRGATFKVYLPLLKTEAEIQQPSESLEPELLLTGVRVLAIDDEPDAQELLKALLGQYGAEVMTVASATEGLTALESFHPDVLISDIGMPEIDGYMLLQQVRDRSIESKKHIPAIALTAYIGEIDRERAFAAGYQHHLTKPLNAQQLVQAIVALTSS